MWRPWRGLPARRIDRDDGRNLAGISNQDEAWRHLAEQHEVRPCHLPRLFDDHHIERVVELDDPTCGGGTTAMVAEEWGRRWITIDTSRVAISLRA
jgi:hypothetical protein